MESRWSPGGFMKSMWSPGGFCEGKVQEFHRNRIIKESWMGYFYLDSKGEGKGHRQ